VLELAGQFVIEASTSPQQLDEFFTEVVRLLQAHAESIDLQALQRARRQIAVRELRALERPARRLESAALDLFAMGRLRTHAQMLDSLADVGAAQVRDAFATMLGGGAAISVAGKLRRGAEHALRSLAAPLLRA